MVRSRCKNGESLILRKPSILVPLDVLFDKIKKLPINPYVINCVINVPKNRYQRVCVDGIKTEYLLIDRGVPQGAVFGPLLFSIMINDIKRVLDSNLPVTFELK